MAEQHPTIPGVTVEVHQAMEYRVGHGNQPIPYPVRKLKINNSALLSVWAWVYPLDGRPMTYVANQFPPQHAETIITLIRDQSEWLKQQVPE